MFGHLETMQDAKPIIMFFLIAAIFYTVSSLMWFTRFERKNKAIWHLPEVQDKVKRKVMIFGATVVSWLFLMMLVLKILSDDIHSAEISVLIVLPVLFVLMCITGIKRK